MPKIDQTYIQYDYQVLSDPYYDECRIIFTDERTLQLCLSGLRFAEWVNTRWYIGNQQTKLNAAQKEQATDWAERAIGDLLMACDPTEINNNLDRLATALESINEKTIERYTYQEFIDDLESAFGIGHVLYSLVDSIFGLMPNLKLKADWSKIMISTVETYTRWKPLHASLYGLNASLGTVAAAQAAGKILNYVSAFFAALGVVGNGWKDLILGDKSLYDGLLKPIWNLFISDSDGGTGGADPDNDPTNRISVNLNQNLIINNTINALCCGVASSISDNLSGLTGVIVDVDSTEIDTTGATPPTNPDITWTTQSDPDYERCQAAHYIVDWLILFYGSSDWQLAEDSPDSNIVTSVIQGILAEVPPIGVTLSGLSALIGQVLTYLVNGNTGLFSQVNSLLSTHNNDLVCALYNAPDIQTAINDFMDILETNGLNPIHAWALELFLAQNNVLGLLWFDNGIVDYSNKPADCAPCADCPDVFTLWGTRTSQNHWVAELQSNIYHVDLSWNATGMFSFCGGAVNDVTVTVTSGTAYWSAGGQNTFRLRQQDNTQIYNSHTPPSDVDNVGACYFWSDTPFEVDILWS